MRNFQSFVNSIGVEKGEFMGKYFAETESDLG